MFGQIPHRAHRSDDRLVVRGVGSFSLGQRRGGRLDQGIAAAGPRHRPSGGDGRRPSAQGGRQLGSQGIARVAVLLTEDLGQPLGDRHPGLLAGIRGIGERLPPVLIDHRLNASGELLLALGAFLGQVVGYGGTAGGQPEVAGGLAQDTALRLLLLPVELLDLPAFVLDRAGVGSGGVAVPQLRHAHELEPGQPQVDVGGEGALAVVLVVEGIDGVDLRKWTPVQQHDTLELGSVELLGEEFVHLDRVGLELVHAGDVRGVLAPSPARIRAAISGGYRFNSAMTEAEVGSPFVPLEQHADPSLLVGGQIGGSPGLPGAEKVLLERRQLLEVEVAAFDFLDLGRCQALQGGDHLGRVDVAVLLGYVLPCDDRAPDMTRLYCCWSIALSRSWAIASALKLGSSSAP